MNPFRTRTRMFVVLPLLLVLALFLTPRVAAGYTPPRPPLQAVLYTGDPDSDDYGRAAAIGGPTIDPKRSDPFDAHSDAGCSSCDHRATLPITTHRSTHPGVVSRFPLALVRLLQTVSSLWLR
jgi:hypothetical protein